MSNDNVDTNSNSGPRNRSHYEADFAHFLADLDDFLYSEGWYVQGRRIIKRNLSTYETVEKYLFDHCYDREEAAGVVNKIKQQTMNGPLKEYWERGYNDYWNGVNQNNCPTYPELERRNAWNEGWLFAKWGDEVQHEIPNENVSTPD